MFKKIFTLSVFMFLLAAADAQSFFTRADESRISLRSNDERTVIPEQYEVFSLDVQGLKSYLSKAPLEFKKEQGLLLEIPAPEGEMKWFYVYESPVMEAEISARYPDIKSYIAYSKNGGERMRFALSVQGFYAALDTEAGDVYIDPYSELNTSDYVVYYSKYHNPQYDANVPLCGVDHEEREAGISGPSAQNRTDIVNMRVFRLAMACTVEWGTKARRGTVEKCLADMNTMITRMNAIYEKEMAIRFVIINDNEKLIFLNSSNDPYSSVNTQLGRTILGMNTGILNNRVGANAYDVGHVLSVCYDIGGVALGGSACQNNKGAGVTCNNDNDLVNIVKRVMAHEVGHQFDASHTWNICQPNVPETDQQRAGSWAYEPGSGSTIMSYAGSCGVDNVVTSEDEYFHVGSLTQMYRKTNAGGNAFSCSQKIATSNHYPTVSVPNVRYIIPMSTPFELRGSGTDEDGDQLTYCWEQYDLGPKVPLGTNSEEGPLFRSYKPSTDGDIRFFPTAANLLSGNLTHKNEVLPNKSRVLTFRLTVRDNNPEAGGVVWDEYKLDVTDQAGPFKLIYPDRNERFKVGQSVAVTWDVANTDQAPVNCQKVNIYGSFSAAIREDDPNLIPLALGVPNNGEHNVIIPNKISNLFRIIVKAADNIFLTSSTGLNRIEEATEPTISISSSASILNICQPEAGEINYTTIGLGGFTGEIGFIISGDLPAGVEATIAHDKVTAGDDNKVVINTDNVVGNVSGQLVVKAFADGLDTVVLRTNINVEGGDIDFATTSLPANGAEGVSGLVTFEWNAKPDAVTYEIEVSSSPDFSNANIVERKQVTDLSYRMGVVLDKSTIYYWRVRANNNCRNGQWSAIQAFITEALSCKEYKSGERDIVIGTAANITVELPLEVTESGIISDLNINLIKGTHNRLVDLVAYLVAPSGKEALLWSKQCGNQQNLNLSLDDQAPDFFQCPINTGRLYRTDVPRGADKLEVFNGEQMNGTWKLRLLDAQSGQGGRLQELNLDICASINVQSPFLVTNQRMEIHPGEKLFVTRDLLEAQDNDNSASELVYTLVSVPAVGAVTLNGQTLAVGATFTQDDLNNNRLRYDSDADFEGDETFSFTVYDGNGGWIGITNFNIWIDQSVPVGTKDITLSQDVFVFPNPAYDKLNVVLTGKALSLQTYKLMDVSGRVVTEGKFSGQSNELDMNLLEKGVYILHITDGKQSVNKKVMKI